MAQFPDRLAPMLCWAARSLPADHQNWALELKHDGFRGLVFWNGSELSVQSRNQRPMTAFYPELQAMSTQLGRSPALLDGELVAYDEQGRPSLESMQRRAGMVEVDGRTFRRRGRAYPRVPIAYHIFDILIWQGQPRFSAPYRERRRLLEDLQLQGPHWLTPENYQGRDGEALLALTRSAQLEGLVAKRLDSPYRPGERSPDWLKLKNWSRQDLVVGGWREDRESGLAGWLGSLLLGYYQNGRLRYAGGLELGLEPVLDILSGILSDLETADCPFEEHRKRPGTRYLKPLLVVEVQFLGWTERGRLRQPCFKGFALDRDPIEVARD